MVINGTALLSCDTSKKSSSELTSENHFSNKCFAVNSHSKLSSEETSELTFENLHQRVALEREARRLAGKFSNVSSVLVIYSQLRWRWLWRISTSAQLSSARLDLWRGNCEISALYLFYLVNWVRNSLCGENSQHCNTLQHTATHCNTLQHTATHCNSQMSAL